jgi:phage terminase large subunit-like protein
MTREDEKFYKAVISLQGHPDFEIVRERIKTMYAVISHTWYDQQPEQYARFAGKANILRKIISDLDALKAMSELDAAKKATEKPNPGSIL